MLLFFANKEKQCFVSKWQTYLSLMRFRCVEARVDFESLRCLTISFELIVLFWLLFFDKVGQVVAMTFVAKLSLRWEKPPVEKRQHKKWFGSRSNDFFFFIRVISFCRAFPFNFSTHFTTEREFRRWWSCATMQTLNTSTSYTCFSKKNTKKAAHEKQMKSK